MTFPADMFYVRQNKFAQGHSFNFPTQTYFRSTSIHQLAGEDRK